MRITLLLALTALLWAQGDRASIAGLVTDRSGAVLAGAPVTAANLRTGVVAETRSTAAGT